MKAILKFSILFSEALLLSTCLRQGSINHILAHISPTVTESRNKTREQVTTV